LPLSDRHAPKGPAIDANILEEVIVELLKDRLLPIGLDPPTQECKNIDAVAAFGTAINPHFFRDIAATTVAHIDPAHVRISAQLLGHSSFVTTEKYYVRANMVAANRRRQAGILRLRHTLPKPID
jgi:integrase